MQTRDIQAITNTNTFKDFHTPNGVLCQNFENHFHGAAKYGHDNPVDTVEVPDKKNGAKKAVPLIMSAIGAIIPLIAINKLSGKHLDMNVLKNGKMLQKLDNIGEYFKIDDVKRILLTALGALTGGLAGGFIVDKDKENRKEKVKEAVFEMTNIATPTLISGALLKLVKSHGLDKGIGKVLPFIIGVGAGVPLASKISGEIGSRVFNEDKSKQRKFKPSDLLVHIDDIIEVLVLPKFSFVENLQIDKLLALIYIKCGYEAGTADEHSSGHHHHH